MHDPLETDESKIPNYDNYHFMRKEVSSRIEKLEEVLRAPLDDEAGQAHRDELLRKFEDFRKQLQYISRRLWAGKAITCVRAALQEAISDYIVMQQAATHEQLCKLMDAVGASALNSFRSARAAEYRHTHRKGCPEGTQGPVLDKIECWMNDFEKPSVYWLHGVAGTGKSAIAQTIAERMSEHGKLGASFFCSRDSQERNDPYLIFPTLAVQLARKYTQFRSIFVPLAQSDPGIAYETLRHQMDKLLVRPLKEADISTVIIIDALDECEDEEHTSAILSVLNQFVSQIPKVKFFLTGRPDSQIRKGFHLPLLAEATEVTELLPFPAQLPHRHSQRTKRSAQNCY